MEGRLAEAGHVAVEGGGARDGARAGGGGAGVVRARPHLARHGARWAVGGASACRGLGPRAGFRSVAGRQGTHGALRAGLGRHPHRGGPRGRLARRVRGKGRGQVRDAVDGAGDARELLEVVEGTLRGSGGGGWSVCGGDQIDRGGTGTSRLTSTLSSAPRSHGPLMDPPAPRCSRGVAKGEDVPPGEGASSSNDRAGPIPRPCATDTSGTPTLSRL